MSALDKQEGGSHYKDCSIQPVQYIEANNIAFLEGCVIKRCTRHDKPTGKGRQDIEKAIHELQLLLELRYSGAPESDGWIKVTSNSEPRIPFDYYEIMVSNGGCAPINPRDPESPKLRWGEGEGAVVAYRECTKEDYLAAFEKYNSLEFAYHG